MNKNAIQKFAIWARRELIAQVSQRAYQYGIDETGFGDATADSLNGRLLTAEEKSQRQELIKQIVEKGYRQVMEEVAYTWFNRFIALRFMEVNNYLPSHIRVFSDASGAFKPEILNDVLHLDLPGLDSGKVAAYIESNDTEGLYRYLLLTQCNALNEPLPVMFEKMGGYTEMLLPNNILKQDSVLGHMVADVPEEDWTDQVQIIGWLYQYYNTEPKDQVFANLKKNIKISKENIPAATQLFTPDWIVRYMVENSLGRIVISGQCSVASDQGTAIGEEERIEREKAIAERMGWKYYLPEAPQTPEVRSQLTTDHSPLTTDFNVFDIKIIDPCMGSGHILVYAFDVLMQIYEAQGYTQRDAARRIVEKNLYGLDIDKRACQLAYFAVMMKARQYDRRFLNSGIKPNLYVVQGSGDIRRAQLAHLGAQLSELERNNARTQLEAVLDALTDAEEYGSITNVPAADWPLLERFINSPETEGQLSMDALALETAQTQLLRLVKQAQVMAQKYDVVVTNPPYMGASGMSAKLSDFVKKNYPDSKADMFAVFIECCGQMAKKNGYQAMITQHAWMFLSSFEKLRTKLLAVDIVNMAHLGARAFEEIGGEVVQTTSFVIRESHIADYKGTYCRLVEPTSQQGKGDMFLRGENRYTADQSNFSKIPGSPVAYWASNAIFKWFSHTPIGECALLCQGLTTTDNEKYVRVWHEPLIDDIGFMLNPDEAKNSTKRWFPFNKGGSYRKWYGNNELIVNYENNGAAIKADVLRKYTYLSTPDFVVKNSKTYFNEGLTWSALSNDFSIRWFPQGAICADKGQGLFADKHTLFYSCGLLNSCVSRLFLRFVSPTLDFNCGYVRKIPYGKKPEQEEKVPEIVRDSIQCSRLDWDSYETSWDFKRNPLV